jgi:hypothetical protein
MYIIIHEPDSESYNVVGVATDRQRVDEIIKWYVEGIKARWAERNFPIKPTYEFWFRVYETPINVVKPTGRAESIGINLQGERICGSKEDVEGMIADLQDILVKM